MTRARRDVGSTGVGSFRRVLRGPAGFFFLHSGGHAVGAWLYFLPLVASAQTRFPAMMWFTATMLWFLLYAGSTQPSRLPAHLPISRQRVLGYLLAPLAVFLLSGLALEHLWPHASKLSGFAVDQYANDPDRAGPHAKQLYRIVSPSYFWRASWGEPPLVTTPEGVSRRPAAFAVLPGLPLNVYNPYDARLDDDPAFVNYQASRIMTREWHLDVSAADVERACHAVQRGHMAHECLVDQIRTKREQPRAWIAVEAWLLCLIVLLWLRMNTSGPVSRRTPVEWLSLLWSMPTLFALPLALDEVGKHDPTVFLSFRFRLAALLGELTRLVERAPLASSALGLVLLLGFYRYLERAFVRLEGFTARPNSEASAR